MYMEDMKGILAKCTLSIPTTNNNLAFSTLLLSVLGFWAIKCTQKSAAIGNKTNHCYTVFHTFHLCLQRTDWSCEDALLAACCAISCPKAVTLERGPLWIAKVCIPFRLLIRVNSWSYFAFWKPGTRVTLRAVRRDCL